MRRNESTFKLDFNFEHITNENNNININIRSRYGIQHNTINNKNYTILFSHLMKDLFPYYSLKSVTSLLLIIQILVLFFIPYHNMIMKFQFSSAINTQNGSDLTGNSIVLPFLLAPFNLYHFSLPALFAHFVYCLSIVAELEHKIIILYSRSEQTASNSQILGRKGIKQHNTGNDRNRNENGGQNSDSVSSMAVYGILWLIIYLVTSIANLIVLSFFPTVYAISTHMGLYSLYIYLQYHDYLQTEANSHLHYEDNTSESYILESANRNGESGDQLTIVYKCVLISYLVYISAIGAQFGHYAVYLIAIFLGLAFQKGSRKLSQYSTSPIPVIRKIRRNRKREREGENSFI